MGRNSDAFFVGFVGCLFNEDFFAVDVFHCEILFGKAFFVGFALQIKKKVFRVVCAYEFFEAFVDFFADEKDCAVGGLASGLRW